MRRFVVATAIAFIGLCALSQAATKPRPVQVPVGNEWFGDDGTWSPVNVRVGSPQQWVSLFPNTLGQDTWVVGAAGCDNTITCVSKRGGIFKSNQSSTWSSTGFYSLNFQPELGVLGSAYYGLDTIAIGDAISVPGQIVGIINSTEFLLGSLGLGVIPSNFTSNNQQTFLISMVENKSAIPSHSYGYTAGAYYRLKGVPSSLTLGGVDLNRYVPNDISFDMASGFEPVVAINSISVSSDPLSTSATKPKWSEDPLVLLAPSQADYYTIDSSTPFLWLPEPVCDAFALAFNLTYNETLQLYTYGNGTDPGVLTDWNMNFTFTLADLPRSSNSVDISLPYDAFNHKLSFPFPALNTTYQAPPVNYFPLRKAANDSQYTIGRVFLQEAYLTVDYERNNFSISQAKFANDAVTDVKLAGITRPADSIFAGPPSDSPRGLSSGAKAGIGIGAALFVILVIGLVFFCVRKKRIGGPGGSKTGHGKRGFFKRKPNNETKAPVAEATELLGDKRHPQEAPADNSNTRHELPGSAAVEMPAEVPTSYYVMDKARNGGDPAELEHQRSTSKRTLPRSGDVSSLSPSLPPYSPAQVGRVSGSNISPSSTILNSAGPGSATVSSGISGIGPNEQSLRSHTRQKGHGLGAGSSSAHPVSPPEPSPLSPPGHSNRPGNSQSSLILPRSQGDEASMPSRSVSRNSRFREEGMVSQVQQPPLERKYSWEHAR